MRRIASSISIIGGADGPTSIFVAGRLGSYFWIGLAALGIILVGAIIFFVLKSRK